MAGGLQKKKREESMAGKGGKAKKPGRSHKTEKRTKKSY